MVAHELSKLRQLGKKGLLVVALVSAMAGFKAASSLIRVDAAVGSQSPTTSELREQSADFLVCSEASDWQRPSSDQQYKQMVADERYSELLHDKEFQQFAEQFWQHDILSFTTYGLSARMEPVNLSGLWSVADDVWANCYSHDEGSDINSGSLAEAWLMHYQVVDLQWQNNHYVMVVEPHHRGMQVVQFARRETEVNLPLTVMTTQGIVIAHHDADW